MTEQKTSRVISLIVPTNTALVDLCKAPSNLASSNPTPPAPASPQPLGKHKMQLGFLKLLFHSFVGFCLEVKNSIAFDLLP